jgi:hypothetical protein
MSCRQSSLVAPRALAGTASAVLALLEAETRQILHMSSHKVPASNLVASMQRFLRNEPETRLRSEANSVTGTKPDSVSKRPRTGIALESGGRARATD